MVKLANVKPNILDRIKKKHMPAYGRERKVMPKDKGAYQGSCNRSACLKPGAYWYNHSTQRYYCTACAEWLNTDTFNKKDSMDLYGHDLCTECPDGEVDHAHFRKLHDLHRNAKLAQGKLL